MKSPPLDVCVTGSFFFFRAEDGIRGWSVTGVQTCALPIYCPGFPAEGFAPSLQSESEAIGAARKALRDAGLGPAHLQATRGAVSWHVEALPVADPARQIGRASCRERV